MDTAYLLFDGKYTMDDISRMPYKQLLRLIDIEQNLSAEQQEIKAARHLKNQLN